jgi:formylglycine-generating enzyme required for sulfatase activity
VSRAKKKDQQSVPPALTKAPAQTRRRRIGLVVWSLTAGAVSGLIVSLLVHRPFAQESVSSSTEAPHRVLSQSPRINAAVLSENVPQGMTWIPGGVFWMGVDRDQFPRTQQELQDAQPVHLVEVDGFWMDKTEVTNRQFAEFVNATGYRTVAEVKPFGPDVPEEIEPFSFVFKAPERAVQPRQESIMSWWQVIKGADWRHPEGPTSDLQGRENHPVVHVAYADALAFCQWAKKRLPTEAEWEFAARGGLDRQLYCWGNDPQTFAKPLANNWQGEFPNHNECKDGFAGTAPVGSFPPNGFGQFDMSGNVWEWCVDWYHPQYYRFSPARNPQGPLASVDPAEPGVPKRVQRGGSFLCADNFCMRYLPGARQKAEPSSSACNIGFRCVSSRWPS